MRFGREFFRRSAHLTLLIFSITPVAGVAQGDTLRVRADALRFADGVVFTISSPARWDQGDWLVLGGLVAGTSALTFADQPLRHFFQSTDNRFLNGVERVGYHYGKPYSAVGLTAGFYISGIIFKSEWARETGLMLGTSILSSSMVMSVLKTGVGRARPGNTAEHLEFKPFSRAPAFHAFPSGHNSVAFGISLLLAKRVESIPLKVFFYSLAGSTVVSRMYSDAHWFSDVAFGGMLAWFCADTAMERIQANRYRRARMPGGFVWRVAPYPGGLSLRASLR